MTSFPALFSQTISSSSSSSSLINTYLLTKHSFPSSYLSKEFKDDHQCIKDIEKHLLVNYFALHIDVHQHLLQFVHKVCSDVCHVFINEPLAPFTSLEAMKQTFADKHQFDLPYIHSAELQSYDADYTQFFPYDYQVYKAMQKQQKTLLPPISFCEVLLAIDRLWVNRSKKQCNEIAVHAKFQAQRAITFACDKACKNPSYQSKYSHCSSFSEYLQAMMHADIVVVLEQFVPLQMFDEMFDEFLKLDRTFTFAAKIACVAYVAFILSEMLDKYKPKQTHKRPRARPDKIFFSKTNLLDFICKDQEYKVYFDNFSFKSFSTEKS
jgi:hypothetical protein